MSDGNLDLLLDDIAARLTDDPFFGTPGEDSATVCVVKDGGRRESTDDSVEDQIAYELSKSFAAVVIVSLSKARLITKNVSGPFADVICMARVLRNPLSTGSDTNPTALEIAERVAHLWHQYTPSIDAGTLTVTEDVETFIRDDGRIAARVFASSGVSLYASGMQQVATPTITAVSTGGGSYTVTITCATAGAAIFYATGTGKPTPRSGTLYTGAATIGAGTTVRARAYLAGYVRSETDSETLT